MEVLVKMDEVFVILALLVFFCIEGIIAGVAWYIGMKGGLIKLVWQRLRGGRMALFFDKDNSMEFRLLKRGTTAVENKVTNELGEIKKIPIAITKVKHYLRGTGFPVDVVVAGQSENTNLLEKYKPNRSAEYWNQWGENLYQSGKLVGYLGREDKLPSLMEKFAPIFQIIIVCGILLLLAMNYTILSNMAPPGT
jgi:hypothetical protein